MGGWLRGKEKEGSVLNLFRRGVVILSSIMFILRLTITINARRKRRGFKRREFIWDIVSACMNGAQEVLFLSREGKLDQKRTFAFNNFN